VSREGSCASEGTARVDFGSHLNSTWAGLHHRVGATFRQLLKKGAVLKSDCGNAVDVLNREGLGKFIKLFGLLEILFRPKLAEGWSGSFCINQCDCNSLLGDDALEGRQVGRRAEAMLGDDGTKVIGRFQIATQFPQLREVTIGVGEAARALDSLDMGEEFGKMGVLEGFLGGVVAETLACVRDGRPGAPCVPSLAPPTRRRHSACAQTSSRMRPVRRRGVRG
jgi:hypothetical protein